jgi:hypothetical protein
MKAGKSSEESSKQPPDPYEVISDFFERYELHECQHEIWRLLSAAISSEDADQWDKHDRGNAVFFCKNVDEVLKALYQVRSAFPANKP